jgi:hypothetical protein
MGSIRTLASTEDEADCQVTKDTIEGTRLQAIEHINKYQAETIKWCDRKVRLKNIKPGHLVLHLHPPPSDRYSTASPPIRSKTYDSWRTIPTSNLDQPYAIQRWTRFFLPDAPRQAPLHVLLHCIGGHRSISRGQPPVRPQHPRLASLLAGGPVYCAPRCSDTVCYHPSASIEQST